MKFSKANEKKLVDLVLTAMFTAIMIICSQIQLAVGPVPFTLQTLAVFVSAALLGWKRGLSVIAVYILLGLLGLPVFSKFSGGFGVLAGPTGGYIIGFIFTALAVGFLCEIFGRSFCSLILSMVAGLALCYTFGTVWYCVYSGIDFLNAITVCILPFLPADATKILLSAILVKRLDKAMKVL